MNWPHLTFSTVADVVTGTTPPKADPENYGAGIPWVKPPDLDSWDPIRTTPESLSEKGQRFARLLPEGTVMVCCIGSIGRVGIAGSTVTTNQQINSLVFGPRVLPKFGYYYCRSISNRLRESAGKAVVPILNKSSFAQVDMPVPPLSEQRRIVEILDQANALRKKRAESDAKAQRILPALFHHMFTGPRVSNDRWEPCTLSRYMLDAKYGTSTKCTENPGGFPILRIPNVVRGEIDIEGLKYAELPEREAHSLMLEQGDILFVRTNGNRDYVGRCAVFEQSDEYAFASYLIRVRLDKEELDPWYVFAYLQTPAGKQTVSHFIRTTAGQSNLGLEGIRQIPIVKPPIQLQREFKQRLLALREVTRKNGTAQDSMHRLCDCLLHRAFAGDLTAKWREAHVQELLQEMEIQSRILGDRL